MAIDPQHRLALEGRVRVAQRRNDIDGTIEALTGLVNLISIDEVDVLAETREKLGELHLMRGNMVTAREYLEASLALDSQQKKVMRTLITVYQHLGEFQAMADLLEQLICLTANPLVRASLLHYLGEVLGTELKDEQAAIDCLLKAFDLSSSYPPTLWRLIDYYWEKEDLTVVHQIK